MPFGIQPAWGEAWWHPTSVILHLASNNKKLTNKSEQQGYLLLIQNKVPGLVKWLNNIIKHSLINISFSSSCVLSPGHKMAAAAPTAQDKGRGKRKRIL